MSKLPQLWKLSLTFSKEHFEIIAAALSDCGIDSFEESIDGASISFVTPDESLADTIKQKAILFLSRIDQPIDGIACELTPFVDDDWQIVWKKFWQPVRISESLVICPSWCEYQAGAGEQVVFIDTTLAFGTGTHPTTNICLRLLEREVQREHPRNFLDIGCGSGILSIAAAKLGVQKVSGIDNSEDACETARANAEFNKLGNVSFSTQAIADWDVPYELVCANILSSVIVENWLGIKRCVSLGGRLIISGLLESELNDVVSSLQLTPQEIVVKNGWAAILLKAS